MLIDYLNQHQAEFWIVCGFAILIIEVMFLGMATGVLLFAGLGALVTGLLMQLGLLPQIWLAGLSSFGISSGVITVVLWKPLKRLQGGKTPDKDRSSDIIGLEFVLSQDIDLQTPGKTRYSGVDWRVEISPEAKEQWIAAGQRVTVISVDVGVFRVKQKEISKETCKT
ncbi:MAG: NfeD family protein [Burkholderiales bacterium]|nr:NfeD family protein [Nitrosomonas sp.]MCP5275193.1 NfeD family protein [Burkholderiales bacterium]